MHEGSAGQLIGHVEDEVVNVQNATTSQPRSPPDLDTERQFLTRLSPMALYNTFHITASRF